MTTLAQLVEALGPGVLRLLASPGGVDVPVAGVVIHDGLDPPPLAKNVLVLAVGLGPGRELIQLLERIADEGGIAVVKHTPDQETSLIEDAKRIGLPLLGVAHGATWMQIASLLRSAMDADAIARGDDEFGGVAAGDLFAVANAVSAVVDAPVTIEDPHSRVIAYSARQDEADTARMITIVGRQVPGEFTQKFHAEGVFRRLYASETPLYIDDIAADVLPRLAVAVRAGDELLGSIWAAVRGKPSDDKIEAFADAARVVAIHLLRHRLASDVQRGLQTDLISAILGGGPLASDAARRLGLAGDGFRVAAVGMREGDAVDNEVVLLRCWDTLSLHLSVAERRAASALVGGVVYSIIPTTSDADTSRRVVRQITEGYLARLARELRAALLVAIGSHAVHLADIPRSRQDADRVLMVLRGNASATGGVIGEVEDMRMQVLLHRLAELASAEPVTFDGPLAQLVERDARQNSELVPTLRAYLDAFGDVAQAARRLGIHHNTLRYRLQKLQQVPGLDLKDAEQRLAIQLQLRMMDVGDS